MTNIDWAGLRASAVAVAGSAYAPYSGFLVGAAALVDDGRVVTGCNVENASYGLGLCAECGLVSDLRATGGGKLVAISVVHRFAASSNEAEGVAPCGRCRQLLYEFGGAELLVEAGNGVVPLSSLLPDAFGPENLDD
ncbi:MAG: cytidine deaminase [Acidimicrobiales bacterium]